jgi:hypothetical protein
MSRKSGCRFSDKDMRNQNEMLMPISLSRAALLTVIIAATAFSLGAGAQAPAPAFQPSDEQPEDLPAGPGRDETFYACTPCHNFKLISAQGLSRTQWDETLTWMTTRHNMPDIQGEDRQLILGYLEKQYPPKPARAGGWRNPFAPQ